MSVPTLQPLFDIHPAESAGILHLGFPIRKIIHLLQTAPQFRKVHVNLQYSEKTPFSKEIIIAIPTFNIRLYFCPRTQQLNCIEFNDLSKVQLQYHGTMFNSDKVVPTFVSIYNLFGPTQPGDFDKSKKKYDLKYPGLTFEFPVPESMEVVSENVELPLAFPDGTTSVLNKLFVKQVEEWNLTLSSLHPSLSQYFQVIEIERGKGFFMERKNIYVAFGMHCQTVVSILGEPSAVFYKDDEKLNIHSMKGAFCSLGYNNSSDYFYNYFEYGFDLLFHGQQHKVIKCIFHSNLTDHFDFSQYNRCNYHIYAKESKPGQGHAVKVDTEWKDIKQILGPPISAVPAILNRGRGGHPFGSTLFYGYEDMIFEVLKNGYIATVILF